VLYINLRGRQYGTFDLNICALAEDKSYFSKDGCYEELVGVLDQFPKYT